LFPWQNADRPDRRPPHHLGSPDNTRCSASGPDADGEQFGRRKLADPDLSERHGADDGAGVRQLLGDQTSGAGGRSCHAVVRHEDLARLPRPRRLGRAASTAAAARRRWAIASTTLDGPTSASPAIHSRSWVGRSPAGSPTSRPRASLPIGL